MEALKALKKRAEKCTSSARFSPFCPKPLHIVVVFSIENNIKNVRITFSLFIPHQIHFRVKKTAAESIFLIHLSP